MLRRLTLGLANRDVDAKKMSKKDDFPNAQPGDVIFVGFVGVARGNVFWQGGDHLFLASPQYLFSGKGPCFYGLEIEFPVGTPIQVVWTSKGFKVQKLDVRAEYSFDLLAFLTNYHLNAEKTLHDLNGGNFAQPNHWTLIWRLAAAPEPWSKLHKLLLVEITKGCPDDKFQWEQSVAPQQVLVLEGALYQTVTPGQTPLSFGPGQFHSVMGGTVQHVRTDPTRLTRFLVFYTGPQYVAEAPKLG